MSQRDNRSNVVALRRRSAPVELDSRLKGAHPDVIEHVQVLEERAEAAKQDALTSIKRALEIHPTPQPESASPKSDEEQTPSPTS